MAKLHQIWQECLQSNFCARLPIDGYRSSWKVSIIRHPCPRWSWRLGIRRGRGEQRDGGEEDVWFNFEEHFHPWLMQTMMLAVVRMIENNNFDVTRQRERERERDVIANVTANWFDEWMDLPRQTDNNTNCVRIKRSLRPKPGGSNFGKLFLAFYSILT